MQIWHVEEDNNSNGVGIKILRMKLQFYQNKWQVIISIKLAFAKEILNMVDAHDSQKGLNETTQKHFGKIQMD